MRAVAVPLCASIVLCGACASTALQVVAGGDLNLGPRSGDVLAPLAPVLRGDLRIANLEGPLVDGCTPHEETLCAPTSAARTLRGRLNVASLANNHADDQGSAGIASTLAALAANGVLAVRDRAVIRVRGRTLTIFARDLGPGSHVPDELFEAIAATPSGVIVLLHWGETGMLQPTRAQRIAARRLIDHGVTAVIGSGPHTMQPVERYGDGIIAYSLGNLAFECDCSTQSDSALLAFEIDAHLRVQNARLVPIYAGVRGNASAPSRDPQLVKLLDEIHRGLAADPIRGSAAIPIVSPARGD